VHIKVHRVISTLKPVTHIKVLFKNRHTTCSAAWAGYVISELRHVLSRLDRVQTRPCHTQTKKAPVTSKRLCALATGSSSDCLSPLAGHAHRLASCLASPAPCRRPLTAYGIHAIIKQLYAQRVCGVWQVAYS
jgi:hypothetical protein